MQHWKWWLWLAALMVSILLAPKEHDARPLGMEPQCYRCN